MYVLDLLNFWFVKKTPCGQENFYANTSKRWRPNATTYPSVSAKKITCPTPHSTRMLVVRISPFSSHVVPVTSVPFLHTTNATIKKKVMIDDTAIIHVPTTILRRLA